MSTRAGCGWQSHSMLSVPEDPCSSPGTSGTAQSCPSTGTCGERCCQCAVALGGPVPIPQSTGVPLKVFEEKSYCMGTVLQL